MIVGHGGNIYETAKALGCRPEDIVDMSSNMNPLGPLPGLMAHLQARLESVCTLPQADAGSCVRAFSKRHGLDPETVLAGNGTTQFIYILPMALQSEHVLILAPTYADYADACRMHEKEPSFFFTLPEQEFKPDMARLDLRLIGCDTAFVCNPNNPTGAMIPKRELTSLCRSHRDTRFIIDESYMPFAPAGDAFSMAGCGLPNVIVLNSMSKLFRIPGLRIGFVIAHPDILQQIGHYATPWSVNTLAQEAVEHLMSADSKIDDFIEETRRFLSTERDFFRRRLAASGKLTTFESRTSYVLARLSAPHTADSVGRALLADRILIRNCANFKGLSDRYIRISLKTPEINRMMAEKLNEHLKSVQ